MLNSCLPASDSSVRLPKKPQAVNLQKKEEKTIRIEFKFVSKWLFNVNKMIYIY